MLAEMTDGSSTADASHIRNDSATYDYISPTAAFLDPARHLANAVQFYFQYAIIGIGIFGTTANALVLYGLVTYHVRETKKRAVTLLMINQNVLDLSSCVLLIITYSIKVSNMYLTGALGYFLCTVFINDSAQYCALYGSIINLMAITVERYLKVVHPFWSKKYLKRWVIYVTMVFAWIGGILRSVPVAFVTTRVRDGVCLPYFVWESPEVRTTYMFWKFISFCVVPAILFVYCYGLIALVVRRQARVMDANNIQAIAQMNAAQMESKRVKWAIVKTTMIVSMAFVICWLPVNIFPLVLSVRQQPLSYMRSLISASIFLAYLYICMNPFIYAITHDGVKQTLTGLMVRFNRAVEPRRTGE